MIRKLMAENRFSFAPLKSEREDASERKGVSEREDAKTRRREGRKKILCFGLQKSFSSYLFLLFAPSRLRGLRVCIFFPPLMALLAVNGCLVGPDYHAPKQTMPARWDTPPTTQASLLMQQPSHLDQWWTLFGDPELDSLVRRAVVSNLDLEAAAERIHAARASLGIAKGELLPTVDSDGSFTRSGGEKLPWTSNWQAGLNAAWDVDVFGGLRRGVESSDASLGAAVEDRRDVLVTLLGEVATDYITLRGQQQEIVIAQENLAVDTKNAELARNKQKLGTGTDLDNAQADAQVATTEADIATLQASAQQSIYAISVLLGLPPSTLNDELTPIARIPDPPTELPVGLPSDLLRRRPDIRRAERQLAAQTANIGVAVSALFPQFSLSGSVGLQARRIDMLDWQHSFWSFGPGVTWSILDANRLRSNIDLQNALQEQSLTAYRAAVLNALLQVQNVLVAFAAEQHRRVALQRSVDFNKRAVEIATRRYREGGLTDFLSVLDAERALFASQDALVQSNSAVGTDAVTLYRALGGGWEIDRNPATTKPVNH
jgi:NodT family efflux transporter outer membrane factor (OMF) lipoprotein